MDNKPLSFDAEWLRSILPYISTVFLSCWGGAVSYLQRLKGKARKFSMRELTVDLIISSFAGIMTHFLCVYAKIDGSMAAMLIAISGHMGTRALKAFENLRDRVLGVAVDVKQP